MIREVRYEPPKGRQSTSQLLYPFSGSRSLRVHYGLELDGVSLYPPPRYHKAQEFARADAKCALQRVKFHVMSSQHLKGFLQMLCVIGAFFRFDENIIDINFHRFTYQWSEHLGHNPLISCPCVFQVKRALRCSSTIHVA